MGVTEVNSNDWLSDLRKEEETFSTYFPITEWEKEEFAEPMTKISIIAPTRIIKRMWDDIFEADNVRGEPRNTTKKDQDGKTN